MTYFLMLIMFIHIGGGVIWIGSVMYLRFMLLPALSRATPQVRGPLVADIGPRTVRFLLRTAEVTMLAGIVNIYLAPNGMARMSSPWGYAISLGFVFSIAIYGIGQAITKPATMRIAETVRAMAAGQGPADAPALLAVLAAKQQQALTWQAILGIGVVLTMSAARFL